MTTSRSRLVLLDDADLLEDLAELERRAVEHRHLAVHLDQQVAHPVGVERRQEVLDGADALPLGRQRGRVLGLGHGADVAGDLDACGEGHEVDPAVVGQWLEDHAGALPRVEPEAVDHRRAADGALAPAGLGEQRQGRSGGEAALGLGAVARAHPRGAGRACGLERAFVGERTGRRLDRPLVGERLLQVVVGSHLDRLGRGRRGAVARHHDHRGGRIGVAQRLERLQPVAVGEPDVEEDDRRPPPLVERQRLLAARGGQGLVTLVGEDPRQGRQDSRLVVDDQDQLGHRSFSQRALRRPFDRGA